MREAFGDGSGLRFGDVVGWICGFGVENGFFRGK